MRAGGLVVGFCLAFACGGSAKQSGPLPEGASGAAAGMSSGAGGRGGMAGMSNTDPGCAGFSTTSGCIDSCLTDAPLAVNAVCEEGAWVCPPDSISYPDCPPESCYGALSKCCDAKTGAEDQRECGTDGNLRACPSGFAAVERGSLCVPEGVNATSCDALDGEACDDEAYRCSQGGGCGKITCECSAGPEGTLVWQCQSRLC